MIRRISTKLLLAVLAAVVVPFLGFGWFVDRSMAERLSREVVQSSLQGLAAELSSSIDRKIEGYREDVQIFALDRRCNWAIEELAQGSEHDVRDMLKDWFNLHIGVKRDFALILLLDAQGRVVAKSTKDDVDRPLSAADELAIAGHDFSAEPWFQAALAGFDDRVDQHPSPLLAPIEGTPIPERYHIGFSCPVLSDVPGQQAGVVYGLVNWAQIQAEVDQPRIRDYFKGLVGPTAEAPASAYGWVWANDGDTILAHPNTEIYRLSVSRDLGLPALAEATSADRGLYPEYVFEGKQKNAAFEHSRVWEEGGFGWVVGVGINNEDIFQGVNELRGLLIRATAVVLLVSILCTMVIARRTTSPILALREHTRKVASGDLDTRVEVRTKDELGELARAFNEMTAELKHSREQLVKAEKDAAWRAMAQQVAHDIKNPLTPIKLSIDLLERARAERSPDFERILARTIETISRQVANLKEIASDFHALTGTRTARPELFEAKQLAEEVLDLNAAWAEARGVEMRCEGPGGRLHVDPGLLRRVLINLVSNALEAMPDGGRLTIDVRPDHDPGSDGAGTLRLCVTDSGAGIPPDVRARLFEPYFTTRTTGTGLGLAIARRVIEEMGGTIALEPAIPPPGTTARIRLPLAREPQLEKA
jgi:signal transduction histidine kinase